MTHRPCSGCGLKYCDGRCYQGERYLESDPTEEVIAPRPKYIPSAEFAAWLAKVDAERADLEPKKRPDGRWEIAA